MDLQKEVKRKMGSVQHQLQATHETPSAAAHLANDNVVFKQ